MILTDRQIVEAQQQGAIFIDPFDEKQVQGASYDLRVGNQGITTSTKKVVDIRDAGFMTLEPGDFAVVTSFETIRLDPKHVARFGLRSKFARKGLSATTGPQIDPGYRGRLIIGLTNLSPKPITLSHKDDFLTVEFHELAEASAKPYCGPYQGRESLGPEEIEAIAESESMSLPEIIKTLRSLSENVGALTGEVKTLKWAVGAGVAFLCTLGAILALLPIFRH
jgi:dCTP deaminase